MSKFSDFQDLSPQSRVWIYQSNRNLSDTEVADIQPVVQQFATQWVSHNRQLKSGGAVLHNRFLILMVDETQAGASGCSIDSSVRFITELGSKIGVSFFDRLTFPFRENGEIKYVSKDDFEQLFANGSIDDGTLVFDNLVKTKQELETSWEKKLGESWHRRFV